MAMKINANQYGLTSLLKEGYKTQQGLEEAVFRNISAARELGDLVRTSFGPHGLCKLVINQLDKLFLTNDAGTILRELEIEHPAAKLLLQAALQQDKELGDGTNLTVMLAAEMLSQAQGLLRMGLSPSTVAEGFEQALEEAQRIMKELVIGQIVLADKGSVLKEAKLRQLLETVIGSKQPGYEAFLAELALQASSQAMPEDPRRFDPDLVRMVKLQGGSLAASHVVSGLVLQRQPESRVRQARRAKVAVYSCPLNVSRTETKGTVLLTSAAQMMDFSKGEESIVEAQIRSIAESGVGVVVTPEAIGDLCLHHLDRHGIVALRIPSKFELRRLCRAVGATPLARLGAPTAEEAGYVDVLETIEIGGDWCTVLRQESADARGQCRMATIVLRGSSPNLLDDVERALEDAVNTVKTVAVKGGSLVAGAGASEFELALRVQAIGEATAGVEQYAIKAFGRALEAVARNLASNAGQEPTLALARLGSAHARGQADAGILDGDEEGVGSAIQRGIVDSLPVKQSALYLASEAALTILRVDQIIMSKPAGGPKPPAASGPMDADDD